KIGHELKRQQFEDDVPRIRQRIDRKHLTGNEKIQRVDDVQKRRQLQKPETDHANAGFEEEADQKSEQQRNDVGHDLSRRQRDVGKIRPTQQKQESIRQSRRGDVSHLVGGPIGEEIA